MTGSIISGLGAGIDMSAIVTQLMQGERAPEQKISALRLSALAAQSAWGDIGSKLTALQTAAKALDAPARVRAGAATSSDPTTLSATAGADAAPGSTSVTVLRLASAQQLGSGPLTGPGQLVGAGQVVLAGGLGNVGATALSASGAATAGSHAVSVLQASAAAAATATAPPALSFAAGSDGLTVTLADGVTHTVTLGTYADTTALVTDLGAQLAGVADVRLVAGQLRLASRDEGSAAQLTLGGPALASLGLAAGTTTGADAQVSLDGGPAVSVSRVDAGTTVDLGGGFTLTTTNHLRPGTVTTQVLRTDATTTLADLAAELGAAGSPATASLVDTGDGSPSPYRLVVTSRATGTAGALTVTAAGLAVLGPDQLTTVTAATDAQLLVGGVAVTRSSNTVSDLLPGVTLGLARTGTATVSVATDPSAVSTKAQALVDALNGVLASVSTQAAAGSTTSKGGPLSGDTLARGITTQLLDDVLGATGSGATKALSQLGIETTRSGTLTFSAATFAAALQKDPDGVAGLLSGFAASVEAYAKEATSSTGLVTRSASAAGDEARRRQDQVDAFEVRMTALEASYRARFAALDAALGQLKQQQSALASAISSLPAA